MYVTDKPAEDVAAAKSAHKAICSAIQTQSLRLAGCLGRKEPADINPIESARGNVDVLDGTLTIYDGSAMLRAYTHLHCYEDEITPLLARPHVEKVVAAPPMRKGIGGRPPAADWAVVKVEFLRLMEHHGDFSVDDPEWNAVERAYDALHAFCAAKFGREVARTTLQDHVTPWLTDWRSAAGNRFPIVYGQSG
jgi:hypothetical protein